MNLQKFKNKNPKQKSILVMFGITILFISLIILIKSYAIFEEKKEYNAIKGSVPNYVTKDISVKYYLDNQLVSNVPSKTEANYVTSSCNNNALPLWDNTTFSLNIENITNKTLCKIYFSKVKNDKNLKNTILEAEGGVESIKKKTPPSFYTSATEDEGMFTYLDDYGESYYYRGGVLDNYVLFAGLYWRIVRVNGDGSIRLIYMGKTNEVNAVENSIGVSSFNTKFTDNTYVGYMYGETNSNLNETVSNRYNSTIKTIIDSWYYKNLKTDYENYLNDTYFCNDRSIQTGSGTSNSGTSYNGYKRVMETKVPTLNCNKNDRFTVSDTAIGNGALEYPIALLNVDEAMLAGIVRDIENTKSFLYNGSAFTTMTPGSFRNFSGFDKPVSTTWVVNINYGNTEMIYASFVRPVINLKNDTLIVTGNGTKNNPYVIK